MLNVDQTTQEARLSPDGACALVGPRGAMSEREE